MNTASPMSTVVTAQLRRVPEGGSELETVATIQVTGDGTYRLHDPEGYVPTELAVLVVDEAGRLQRVHLEDDPRAWVQNLPSLMRTGYLVPVITEDQAEDQAAEAHDPHGSQASDGPQRAAVDEPAVEPTSGDRS